MLTIAPKRPIGKILPLGDYTADSRVVKVRRVEAWERVSKDFEEREKIPFPIFLQQYSQENPEMLETLLEDCNVIEELKEEWKAEGKSEFERSAEEILFIKDQVSLSDDAYLKTRKALGFKEILPPLSQVLDSRKKWNEVVSDNLSLVEIDSLNGYKVSLAGVISLILRSFPIIEDTTVLQLKLSFDGRVLGKRHEVLVGVIPLNTTAKVQSPFSVYPIALFEGKETLENMKIACSSLIDEMNCLQEHGFQNGTTKIKVEFFLVCDLKSFWTISNRRYSNTLLTLVGVYGREMTRSSAFTVTAQSITEEHWTDVTQSGRCVNLTRCSRSFLFLQNESCSVHCT